MSRYDPRSIAVKPANVPVRGRVRKYDIDYQDDSTKTCITIFRRLPWLKDDVEQVYVNPVKLPEKYYDENQFYIFEDKKFYKVKQSYYQLRCFGTIIDIDTPLHIVSVNFRNEVFKFQVGLKIKSSNKGISFVIQNESMFNEEKQYFSNMRKSGISVNSLKSAKVSEELKNVARISLCDYTPDSKYLEGIINSVEKNSKDAFDFALSISKILNSAKYGNVFPKRLKKGYYTENIVHLLDYDSLLEGSQYELEKVEEYIEDSSINMLIYASKYYDIPVRKYQREDVMPLKLNKFDLRMKCANIDDVKDIPEENITFYNVNRTLYCYDVSQLYYDFKRGNYINPKDGLRFSKEFINKVKNIYNFKIKNVPTPSIVQDEMTSQDYDDIVASFDRMRIETDPTFTNILEQVRSEIDKLSLFPTTSGSRNISHCAVCRQVVGKMGITSLDNAGKIIKHCSRACFEK